MTRWQVGIGPHGNITGLSAQNFVDNLLPDFDDHWNFTTVVTFLLYVWSRSGMCTVDSPAHRARRSPCFLGIFFGANNVQNLRRPNRSIPLGAFGAICTSLVLYTTFLCLLAAVADRETLKTNPLLFCDCAWPSRWVAISGLLVVGLGGVRAMHACAEE